MASEAQPLSELLISLIWACLSTGSYKNPLFNAVIPDKTTLVDLFTTAQLSFEPELLTVLQADAPPSATWFEFLSSLNDAQCCWGVYVVVLRKEDSKPLIYIGSGTHGRGGVRHRLRAYDYEMMIYGPFWVRKMIQEGYKITTKTLLATAPMPKVADVPRMRTLVLALEATMAMAFWAMWKTDQNYGFNELCPWPEKMFQYRGLCSHNPLVEGIGGIDRLTEDELKAVDLSRRERRRTYRPAPRADSKSDFEKRRAYDSSPAVRKKVQARLSRSYHCFVCNFFCRTLPAARVHVQTRRHIRLVKATGQSYLLEACECVPCGEKFPDGVSLKFHEESRSHQLLMKKEHLPLPKKASRSKTYECVPCDMRFTTKSTYENHLKKKSHRVATGSCSESEINTAECIPCGKTFSSASNYRAHLKTSAHLKETNPSADKSVSSERLKCILCGQVFDSPSSCIKHLTTSAHLKETTPLVDNSVSSESLKCIPCGEVFRHPSSYERHLTTKAHLLKTSPSVPSEGLKCVPCGLVFQDASKYQLHLRSKAHLLETNPSVLTVVRTNDGHKCVPCGMVFPHASNLKKHLTTKSHKLRTSSSVRKSGTTRRYKCVPCGTTYSSAGNLRTHEKTKSHREGVAAIEAHATISA